MADVQDLLVRIDATTEQLRRELKRAEQAVAGSSRKIDAATKRVDRSFQMMGRAALRLAAPLAAAFSVREITQAADAVQQMENQLRLVTTSAEQLAEVQESLFSIAQGSNVAWTSTAELYARLARSTENLNLSQAELLGLTETITHAMRVSGASASAMNAALIQLGQGFASGVLRGEELNSIMEQTPRLAQAIADGMGVTIGELRKLGKEGRLTTEVVSNALRSQSVVLAQEADKMQSTVGQATVNMANSFLRVVGTMDEASGASGALASAITRASSALDELATKGTAANRVLVRIMELYRLSWQPALDGLDLLSRATASTFGIQRKEIRRTVEELQAGAAAYKEFLETISGAVPPPALPSPNDLLSDIEIKVRARPVFELMPEFDGSALEEQLRLSIQEQMAAMGFTAERLELPVLLEPEIHLETLESETDRMMEGFASMGESMGRSLENSFADALMGVETDFGETMKRMLANAAVNQLFTLLGGLGGPAGKAFSFLGFGDRPPTRHSGGPVSAGKPYLVKPGEETFIPTQSGQVVPNNKIAAAGSSISVNIVNNVQGAQVETRQTGPNGLEIVINAVGSALASGRFDPVMGGRFGMRPTTGIR